MKGGYKEFILKLKLQEVRRQSHNKFKCMWNDKIWQHLMAHTTRANICADLVFKQKPPQTVSEPFGLIL